MNGGGKSTRPGTGSRVPNEETERLLASILEIIKSNPGVRPSEINRRLNRVETDSLRAALIRPGLVRKVKEGQTTRLYAS
jgi:hypothetical protein